MVREIARPAAARDAVVRRSQTVVVTWARLGALWLAFACGTASPQQRAWAATNTGVPEGQHVNVVASSSAFANVNHDDAKAAMQTWLNLATRQRAVPLDTNVDIIDSVREILGRLENHSAEMLILTTADFLEIENSHLAVPVLTHALTSRGVAPYSYLLLVSPSSPATTIADLRGKTVLAASRGGSNTARVWLEVLLSKENLGRSASFFASLKVPQKGQECILSLFFGKVDACAVDEVTLNLAKELNPQLGQLKVLARSRPMVGSVIATPVEPTPHKDELIGAALALHNDPNGRQLLQLFKTERVVRLQPGDLDSARELFAEYHRLEGASPISPKGFVSAEKRLAAPEPEKH
jgi:ABC-type phosphate/phosphonate transport system substrate-binding protein